MTERPAYLRVADELRAGIRDGTYPPGSRLPSLRALAAQHGLSDIVIRAAFAVLRNEGLVTTHARARMRLWSKMVDESFLPEDLKKGGS